MVFLHPWALILGLAAMGLPVVVHWLTRPRPRRLPLSTLRFVREVVHQRRALHRLRDWLILSLRMAAVLLLAWAFARPWLGARQWMVADEPGEVSRVVIVDASQSMAAVQGGVSAFERARSTAGQYLVGGAGQQAGLILAGAQPRRVFDSLSANFAELRSELARTEPLPERCNVQQALVAAAELLGRAPGGKEHRRELIVVTDLQQSNWQAADFSVLPAATIIRLESVADEQAPPNLAILRAGVAGRPQFGRPARIEIEVGNYSQTSRNVTVDVTLGQGAWRLEGICPAGGKAVLLEEVALPQAGWQSGEARLVGIEDAVRADNSRFFVVEVRPRPTYGLITREEVDRRPSSSYYLQRALLPEGTRGGQGADAVMRISPGQINREMLASADLLVIDRPGKLEADAIGLLAALMIRGKSILYVASESTDATNLEMLRQRAGSELQLPVQFVPPSHRQSRRGRTLVGYRQDLPPFSIFGQQVAAAIEPLRFTRGLDSRAVDGALKDDVLASYDDGTAGLVWTSCGAGWLAVLNADLAESNLAVSPAFVPLVGELTGNLLARNRSTVVSPCGEPVTLWLPPDVGTTGLQISGPSSEADGLGELVDEPAGLAWRWPAAGPPGVYEVTRDGRCVLALATALPAEESDLRSLPSESLTGKLAGGRTIHYRSARAGGAEQDLLWTWIAVACVAFMLVELLVLRLFKT